LNAAQSSTDCYGGPCHPASRAIDGDSDTFSSTEFSNGTHWLKVSMSPQKVDWVVLDASTNNDGDEINLSLYREDALVGYCRMPRRSEYIDELKYWCDSSGLTVDSLLLSVSESKWHDLPRETRMSVREVTVGTTADTDSTQSGTDCSNGVFINSDVDHGLFNATQSSTKCDYGMPCYNASNAIDGNRITWSRTEPSNDTTWLKVSMLPQTVDWVTLEAFINTAYHEEIKVSLYREGIHVGDCNAHPGSHDFVKASRTTWPSYTLWCGNSGLTVDSVMLTIEWTERDYYMNWWTSLYVYEVTVGRWGIPEWVYLPATGLGFLGISTILANAFVIGFYKKKWQETIPFIYIMIAVCDSVTGSVALCHALMLTNHPSISYIIEAGHTYLRSDLFLVLVYIVLQSGTRTSLFYNVVLTAVRTINITQPFYLIKKHIILVCVTLYPMIWFGIMIVDSYLGLRGKGVSVTDVIFLVYPGWDIILEWKYFFNEGEQFVRQQAIFITIFLAIPLALPAVIAIICAILQIYSLMKPSKFTPTTMRERQMTVTILILTMLCLVCNMPLTILVLYRCVVESGTLRGGTGFSFWKLSETSYYLFSYSLGTLLPFLQALLNPAILLLRGAALRTFVVETFRFRRFSTRRNPTVVTEVNTRGSEPGQ